jgi:hypothetical protein
MVNATISPMKVELSINVQHVMLSLLQGCCGSFSSVFITRLYRVQVWEARHLVSSLVLGPAIHSRQGRHNL